jgi:hypothetical protein
MSRPFVRRAPFGQGAGTPFGLPTGTLALAVVAVGLFLTALLLVAPVRASFGDDPVLRLQGFDRQRSFLSTSVSCGPAPGNLAAPAGARSVYDLARDDACHRASVRRLWVALALGATVVVASFAALAVAGRRA